MNKKFSMLMGTGLFLALLGFCVLHTGTGILFSGIAASLFFAGAFILSVSVSYILSEEQRIRRMTDERIAQSIEEIARIPQYLSEVVNQMKTTIDAITVQLEKAFDHMDAELESAMKNICQNVYKTAETVVRSFDDVTGQVSEEFSSAKDSFNDLLDELDVKFSGTSKVVRDGMTGITDDLRAHEESIKACIDTLSAQYKEFERTSESLVEQMTLMTANDLKALKDLMNG